MLAWIRKGRSPYSLLVGVQSAEAPMENSVELPSKTRQRLKVIQLCHSWAYTQRLPYSTRDTCSSLFFIAPFTTDKEWKQSNVHQ